MADNLPRIPPPPTVENEDPQARQEDDNEPPPLGPPPGPPPAIAGPLREIDAEELANWPRRAPLAFPNHAMVWHADRNAFLPERARPEQQDILGQFDLGPGDPPNIAHQAALARIMGAPIRIPQVGLGAFLVDQAEPAANDQDPNLPDRETFFRDYLSVGTTHYLNLATYTLGEAPTDCFICKNVFGVIENEGDTPELAILLPCGHAAGHICLKRWFCDVPAGDVRPRNCCPYCSTKFFKDGPYQAAMMNQDGFMGVWDQGIPPPPLPPVPPFRLPQDPALHVNWLHNGPLPPPPLALAAAAQIPAGVRQLLDGLLAGHQAWFVIDDLRQDIQWMEQQRAAWVHQLNIEQDDALKDNWRQRILNLEASIQELRQELNVAEQANPAPGGAPNNARPAIIPPAGGADLQPPAQADAPPAQADPADVEHPPELAEDFPDDDMPDLGPVLPAEADAVPPPVFRQAAFVHVIRHDGRLPAFDQALQPAEEDHVLMDVVEDNIMHGMDHGFRGQDLRDRGAEIVRQHFQTLAPAIPPPDAREIAEAVEAVANRLENEEWPIAEPPIAEPPHPEPLFAARRAGEPPRNIPDMARFRNATLAAGITARDIARMPLPAFLNRINEERAVVEALRDMLSLVLERQLALEPAPDPVPELAPDPAPEPVREPEDVESRVQQDAPDTAMPPPGFLGRVFGGWMT
ncbi:uncharacterized protein BDZ99DRAFT_522956 [Mytilinidion resinicola]|uniref:RING-type domain-containing protein n=1 Tax=Mytilinidion resinicola TaxID=574789 RepID=A0A6A6YEX3_9PEZI|nr:uncharacterized protein BDZ99DRAFT_522956 [Mytilinidion resinicola]KAF2807341.1 hypothetical protein BDZ99DRAFT_522956 [Mytilinidion resinicola]